MYSVAAKAADVGTTRTGSWTTGRKCLIADGTLPGGYSPGPSRRFRATDSGYYQDLPRLIACCGVVGLIKIIAVLCHLSVPANCHEQKSPSRTSLTSRSVLPDGRAAARRVDEAASDRAPGSMALRHRQTGWQKAPSTRSTPGELLARAAMTGSPVMKERPRSPWSAWPSQRM